MAYTVEVEADLKIPLRIRVAEEDTTVKQWVSGLIRKALADADRTQEKAA